MAETEKQTILVTNTGRMESWMETLSSYTAKKGTVHHLFLHGTRWSPEPRANPPRIRLLADHRWGKYTKAELLDPFPGAPTHWPWAPGHGPGEVPVDALAEEAAP